MVRRLLVRQHHQRRRGILHGDGTRARRRRRLGEHASRLIEGHREALQTPRGDALRLRLRLRAQTLLGGCILRARARARAVVGRIRASLRRRRGGVSEQSRRERGFFLLHVRHARRRESNEPPREPREDPRGVARASLEPRVGENLLGVSVDLVVVVVVVSAATRAEQSGEEMRGRSSSLDVDVVGWVVLVVEVADATLPGAAATQRASHLLFAVGATLVIPANLLRLGDVANGPHLHGVLPVAHAHAHRRVGIARVRRAGEDGTLDHPVDEERVVSPRVRRFALDDGVVKHGNLVVPSNVATNRLRRNLLLEPAPPGVQFPAVGTQVGTRGDTPGTHAHQSQALGTRDDAARVLRLGFRRRRRASSRGRVGRTRQVAKGGVEGNLRAFHRRRAHRSEEKIDEGFLIVVGDVLGERGDDPLAAIGGDPLELHHAHVGVERDGDEGGRGGGGSSRRGVLGELGGGDVAGAGGEARGGVGGAGGVDLLGRDVRGDDLDRAGDDVLTLGSRARVRAGALDHGVVHPATDAQTDRLDELLLGELHVRGGAAAARRAARLLGLGVLERRELGHDGIHVLVVVRVPDVHRGVRLRRGATLARHRSRRRASVTRRVTRGPRMTVPGGGLGSCPLLAFLRLKMAHNPKRC